MARLPRAEMRKVFGYPAAFTNGQMFTGLHQESMILRLPDEDRIRFLQLPGAAVFEPMPGRPMRETVVAPPAMIESDAALEPWLYRVFAYANALPPKPARPAAKRPKTGKP